MRKKRVRGRRYTKINETIFLKELMKRLKIL